MANPLAGQTLAVRYGDVGEKHGTRAYTLQILQDDGSPLNLRMTYPVRDALFGPPISGTPERQQREAARKRRQRELDGTL